MSVQKKSLISNREAVTKARIASQPAETEGNSLKANSHTAQSMRRMKQVKVFAPRAFKKA